MAFQISSCADLHKLNLAPFPSVLSAGSRASVAERFVRHNYCIILRMFTVELPPREPD